MNTLAQMGSQRARHPLITSDTNVSGDLELPRQLNYGRWESMAPIFANIHRASSKVFIMQIPHLINLFHGEMTAWRQDLHAHPELGFEEHRTSEFVACRLAEFGCEVSVVLDSRKPTRA